MPNEAQQHFQMETGQKTHICTNTGHYRKGNYKKLESGGFFFPQTQERSEETFITV